MKIEVSAISLSVGRGADDAPAQQSGSSVKIIMPEGATVADLLGRLGDQRLQIQKVLVNGDDAAEDRLLRDGDAVAFVGQVSGM